MEVIASQEDVTLGVLPCRLFCSLNTSTLRICDIKPGAMRVSISRVINLERLEIARLTQ